MNLSPRQRSTATGLCALLAPMLIVQGFRAVLSAGGPTDATAATTAPDGLRSTSSFPTPPPVPARVVTPAQRLALDWITHQAAFSDTHSPMDSGPEQVLVLTPIVPDGPPTIPAPVERAPAPKAHAPTLACTSIIAGGSGSTSLHGLSLATINKRVYRMGDEVAPGWLILQIDARRRLVIIGGPDGQTVELSPPAPDPDRTDSQGLW